jgi:hypothetical protein
MEQRLLNAHQDWLAQQHTLMVQWNRAQDVLLSGNSAAILGLSVVVFILAMKVHQLEGATDGR